MAMITAANSAVDFDMDIPLHWDYSLPANSGNSATQFTWFSSAGHKFTAFGTGFAYSTLFGNPVAGSVDRIIVDIDNNLAPGQFDVDVTSLNGMNLPGLLILANSVGLFRAIGEAQSDLVTGSQHDDELNGWDGHDTMNGSLGDDVLNGGDGNDHLRGGGDDDTLFGGEGDDNLGGDAGVNYIYGQDGDDVIVEGGTDTAYGGDGDDRIQITDAQIDLGDHWDGGADNDWIDFSAISNNGRTIDLAQGEWRSGQQAETIENFEHVEGGSGGETILGTEQANIINGNGGNDVIEAKGGNDTIHAGPSQGATVGDDVDAGAGDDTIIVKGDDGALINGARAILDTIDGGADYDKLRLEQGEDGSGVFNFNNNKSSLENIEEIEFLPEVGYDKTLILSAGHIHNTELLNLHIDGYGYDGAREEIEIHMNQVAFLDLENWTFQDWGESNELIEIFGDATAENVYGTSQNDSFHGAGGDDLFTGGAGADTFYGGGGRDTASYRTADSGVTISFANPGLNTGDAAGDAFSQVEDILGSRYDDLLIGDDGDNELSTNLGDDVAYGGGGDDLLKGSQGDDQLFGQADNDELFGGGGADYLHGGDGIDTARFDGAVTVDMEDASQNTGEAEGDSLVSIENLRGGFGADDLRGDSGANQIDGYVGDDRIDGRAGADRLDGGGQDDVIFGGGGEDLIFGGEGDDALRGQADDDDMRGQDGDDDMTGGAGADFMNGGAGNDVALGQSDDDEMEGGSGDDTLRGGAGDDELSGGADNDTLFGQGNNDVLRGETGDDELHGGFGADELLGQNGDDELRGGSGADRLEGGAGADLLVGGAGADILVFGVGDDNDVIASFENNRDTIELEEALWGGGKTVNQVLADYGEEVGVNAVLDFGGGDSLRVNNTTLIELSNDIAFI